MIASSFAEFKRAEARERMASLRRARKSRRVALAEQKAASMFGDASKWHVATLAEVLSAMADPKATLLDATHLLAAAAFSH